MTDVIKRNTAIAESLSKRADAVLSAQIEECVRHLAKSRDLLTPTGASYEFISSFGKSIISRLFFDFCICINKSKLVPQRSFFHRPNTFTVEHMPGANSAAALSLLCGKNDYTSTAGSDFRGCCEDVALGRADYCIIPTESTDDGIFPSFHKLTRAYDLKICGICTVSCADREAEMRFALLGRNIEKCDKAQHIAFSFLHSGNELSELICALHGTDCEISRINTYPAEFSIDKSECNVEVRFKDVTVEDILFFLEAALPGHTVLGIY